MPAKIELKYRQKEKYREKENGGHEKREVGGSLGGLDSSCKCLWIFSQAGKKYQSTEQEVPSSLQCLAVHIKFCNVEPVRRRRNSMGLDRLNKKYLNWV
jgi:hypothetical protein